MKSVSSRVQKRNFNTFQKGIYRELSAACLLYRMSQGRGDVRSYRDRNDIGSDRGITGLYIPSMIKKKKTSSSRLVTVGKFISRDVW